MFLFSDVVVDLSTGPDVLTALRQSCLIEKPLWQLLCCQRRSDDGFLPWFISLLFDVCLLFFIDYVWVVMFNRLIKLLH